MSKWLGHIMSVPGEMAPNPDEVRSMVESFDKVCYGSSGTWFETQLQGTQGWKYPLDVWTNQQMMREARLDSFVQTDTTWKVQAGFDV